jgi:hypothetical protein
MQHQDHLTTLNNNEKIYLLGLKFLLHDPCRVILLLASCASSLLIHVPIFPFVQLVTILLFFKPLLVTFASGVISPHAHTILPKTFVWHVVILHRLELPPNTYVSLSVLPHRLKPLQETFVLCATTIYTLF